jgi:hypothetical protein
MTEFDHLNNIERRLIDNLRTGTHKGGTAWALGEVSVFGEFPEPEDVKYPCIILSQRSSGLEEQFMGQLMTVTVSGTKTDKYGELYGAAYDCSIMVAKDSSMTPAGQTDVYKQRRLLNYIMLNAANVFMDSSFGDDAVGTEVEQHIFTGFRDVGYSQALEVWGASTGFIITFKNTR